MRPSLSALLLTSSSLLLLTSGESPIEHSRRMKVWPQGKWQEITQTEFDVNHRDQPSYLLDGFGVPFPQLRMGHAATMWERQKQMMMFGGMTAGGQMAEPMNDLWQLDIAKRQWRLLLPQADTRPPVRVYHTMFQHEHVTYVFGGATFSGPEWQDGNNRTATYLGDFWAFDPTVGMQGAWKEIGKTMVGLPSARHSMSVSSWEGHYLLFGGQTLAGSTNDLYEYLVEPGPFEETTFFSGSWRKLSPSGGLPMARSAHTTTILDDGTMFLFGGQHNETFFLDDLWRFQLPGWNGALDDDCSKDWINCTNETTNATNGIWTQLSSVGCGANPAGPKGIWPKADSWWHCSEGLTPPARSGHIATRAYLQGSGPSPYGAMVVFGGRTSWADYSNSVWVYYRNRWREHSVYCIDPIDHASPDQIGRQSQCIERGQYEDHARPTGRWRFSVAAYHNRSQENAYHGTELYVFGGGACTLGGDPLSDIRGTAGDGLNDLWVYHV